MTGEAMQKSLEERDWDVVLADYVLPNFGGLAALELLKARGIDIPFIIVSGAIGEDIAVAAMKAGANDYLIKGNLARLRPTREDGQPFPPEDMPVMLHRHHAPTGQG